MLLTHRLALLLGITVALALGASVLLTDAVYRPLQERQLSELLERELDRIAAVVQTGSVGRSFLQEDMRGLSVQFVSNGGQVLLPESGVEALPLHWDPTLLQDAEEGRMIGATPWMLPSGLQAGTIRVALDAGDALASRRTLWVSLGVSGTIIALLTMLVVIAVVRGSLRPLARLAEEADHVDVADPRLTHYRGPDDEVARVANALDQALEGIRARQQAERDALAEVAHELAAPLTLVAGHLRALEANSDGDAPQLEAARAAADELLHTSQDLLILARGELEREPELTVIDLYAKACKVAAEYPGVRTDRDAGDLRVLASPERLRQAVRNLVRNAVQASGRPDAVEVHCGIRGDEVLLEVRDGGPGLGEEAQERIFDRYFSGRASAGAGVGLTVVRRIVETLGGTVSVRSAEGRGSTFTVALPSFLSQMAADDADEDASIAAEGIDAARPGDAGEDPAHAVDVGAGKDAGEGGDGATPASRRRPRAWAWVARRARRLGERGAKG